MREFLLWVLKVTGIPVAVIFGMYLIQFLGLDPVGNDLFEYNSKSLEELPKGADLMVGSSHVYRHLDPELWSAASGKPIRVISGPSQYTTESLLYLEEIARRAEAGQIEAGTKVYFGLEAKLGLGFNFRESYYFSRMRGPLLQGIGLQKPFLSYLIYDAITGVFKGSVKPDKRPEFYPLDLELSENPKDRNLMRRNAYFKENEAVLLDNYRKALKGEAYLSQPDQGLDRVMIYLEELKTRYSAQGLELVLYIPFGDFDVDLREFHRDYPGIVDLRYDPRFENPRLWFDSGHLNAQGASLYFENVKTALISPPTSQSPQP
jgi:hypothetical protein